MAPQTNRKPVVAGMFYPASPDELASQVDAFFEKAESHPVDGEVTAIVSPHAGYIYSGQIAAYGYKAVAGKQFDLVVVLSPSHRVYFKGASIYTAGDYLTPLGTVYVDREACQALIGQDSSFRFYPEAHQQEHALEVQLPFLQRTLSSFKLLPVIMGTQDYASCERLHAALMPVIKGKKVMIVASSDLSHYHSHEEAAGLDRLIVEKIEAFDPEGLDNLLVSGKAEACGGGPIITAMLTAFDLGAHHSKVLSYANSGDVTEDRSAVVGYLSAVFYKKPGGTTARKVGVDLGLTDMEKTTLHTLASETIEARLNNEKIPPLPDLTPVLKEHRGAFVTLTKKGGLRGCIGLIRGVRPLAETIREMAMAAAFQDPRFPPLSKNEWPDIEIEISVLTPFSEVKDFSEIKIGIHGLFIEKGPYSGLLLPQVATEYGWNTEEFLQQTCRKAGLPPGAYKDPDTRVFMFSADIF
jgi:AmmeMemoRadiSam system protein B/AmmeMemoRadiSam system protein A